MFETNELLKKYSKSVMKLALVFISLILVGEIIAVFYMNHSGLLEISIMEKLKRKFFVPGAIYLTIYIIGLILLKQKKLTITQKSIVPVAVVTLLCIVFIVNNNKNSLCIIALILPIILAVLNAETEVEITKRNSAFCIIISTIISIILIIKNHTLGYEYTMNVIVALEFMIALILICSVLSMLERKRNDMLVASVKERDFYHSKAIIDGITKSYNRTSYNDTLNAKFNVYDDLVLAVLDIDKFKSINDTYGHANGDIVLKHLARLLNKLNSDEVYVARYGGEEFVILFFDKTKEEAYKIIEKVKNKFTAHNFKELDNKNVTFSAGIAAKVKKDTKESLFKKADDALYKAKKTGRDKIIIAK